ncbi:MAG TPA: hypothetical protein VHE83_09910 [Mycobacteriales bacterium]|nr:hypothetical protein [Mycobacteriales bacterium]
MIQHGLRSIGTLAATAVVAVGLPAVLAPNPAGAATSSPIVISQLRAQGPGGVGGTDFVELQNVSGSTVTLAAADSWTLRLYKNDGSFLCDVVGTNGSFALPLQPGQHYLFTQSGWTGTGTAASDHGLGTSAGSGGTTCTNLDDSAGRVELLDATAGVDDKVTYGGPVAQDTSTEGNTTLDPNDGSSIRRLVAGTQSTGNNSVDFALSNPAVPLGSTWTDPTVVATDADAITGTTATLHGTVDTKTQTATGCTFDLGTDTTYGSSVPCSALPSGSGTVGFSAAATGLVPGTTYHFRAEITESGGTYPSPDHTFATPPLPTGSTGTADAITTSSATVHGTLNPKGTVLSDCHFDYGTTAAYGSSKVCASTPGGSTDTAVSVGLTGLTTSTKYFYRLVATGPGGTLTTTGSSFTTLAPAPNAPTVVTDAQPTTYLTGAILDGTVNAHGLTVSNCHFEYGLTTAYGTNVACAKPPASTGTVFVSQSIAGLKPGTTYHYRLVVTNSAGVTVGDDAAFTTKSQGVDVVLPPDTTLLPPVVHKATHKVTLTFKARNVVGKAAFQCALVKLPTKKGVKAPAPKYSSCTSPKTTKALAKGHYKFYVRAVDAIGKDPTPASRTFAI